MRFLSAITLLSLAGFVAGCSNTDAPNTDNGSSSSTLPQVPSLSYAVVTEKPHDTSSFTEGLEFYQGKLLEGTGNYGSSRLLEINPANFSITRSVKLEPAYFGEGITVFRDTLYQLTWKERKAFVYTAKDLRKIKELPYNYDGWGLTHTDKELIASDGSSNLYFLEPGTLRVLRIQGVTEAGQPVNNINELEYINGYVWANRWEHHYLMKIDPKNGEVVARVDMTDLVNRVKSADRHADVLNGIAYDSVNRKLYVTGKYWDRLYEVKFEH